MEKRTTQEFILPAHVVGPNNRTPVACSARGGTRGPHLSHQEASTVWANPYCALIVLWPTDGLSAYAYAILRSECRGTF